MRFLVDPAAVRVDAAAWVFLAIVCVLLPIGALRQHRRLSVSAERPTRMQIYASAVATHAGFLLVVWAVTRVDHIDLLPPYRLTVGHLLIGIAALVLGMLPMLDRFQRDDLIARERVRLIAPRSPREFAAFYGVSATAGIAEELAYRGLLFTLLSALFHAWWPAAVVASAAFGIVHLFQGWKSAGIAALMGLREHIVVGLTGSLLVAIVVHTLHDAITGTVVGRRALREEAAALAVS